MGNAAKFYIDGRWTEPVEPSDTFAVVNPATEEEVARVAAASPADVDAAVRAAHRAFASYSCTSREERLEILRRVLEAYQRRIPQIAAAMTTEVGIPRGLAEGGQVMSGVTHLRTAAIGSSRTTPWRRTGAPRASCASPWGSAPCLRRGTGR